MNIFVFFQMSDLLGPVALFLLIHSDFIHSDN